MEVVLDTYTAEPDPKRPLVCMDEASTELHGHCVAPVPLKPGRDAKEDYHYTRHGVRNVFMFFDPHRGWRRVSSRDHRTSEDWALEVQQLLEVDYPEADTVRLLCDNLNTHTITSLYKAFPAPQARALARRLEMIHTPRNGSWLNVAEIELSVLTQQCLKGRISSVAQLEKGLQAWQQERNESGAKVKWQFTTEDARVSLRHLYPTFECEDESLS